MTNTRGGPIIWSLRAIPAQSLQALQVALPVAKKTNFLQPILMRQRPRQICGRIAPDVPVNLPWNAVGLPSLIDVAVVFPRGVHQLLPSPPVVWKVSGVTKDSTGAVLAACVVDVFKTSSDVIQGTNTSNANGEYLVQVPTQTNHYAVAYKVGSPDVAGTTRNDLSPT